MLTIYSAWQDVDKLLADRAALNQEIQERDRTIGEKEQRIYDLKKQNQELEKFKFVLDYKIKQLKALMDPKTRDIQEMQAQIQAMDSELVDYHRREKLSSMELGQLKLKHKALRDEISNQRQQIAQGEQRMRRLQLDIYECMQHLQDPKKLKAGVTMLYRKHLTSELRPADVDTDILKEQTRQRDYLEKAVECLKKRLGKDSEMHRQDNVKLMQENAALICEINELRKEVLALHAESQQHKFSGTAKRGADVRQSGSIRAQKGRGSRRAASSSPLEVSSRGPSAAAGKAQETGLTAAVEGTSSPRPKVTENCSTPRCKPDTGEQKKPHEGSTVAEECAKLIATQASEIAALREKLQLVEKQLESKDLAEVQEQ